MTRQNALTQERLKEAFDYDPQTGRLIWRYKANRNSSLASVGRDAGCVCGQGYIVIKLGGVLYQAHRLVWLYVYGEWAPHSIDHRDGDRANNRIDNLRLATVAQNTRNKRVSRNNRLGIKGVRLKRGKFVAAIVANGQQHHLGTYATAEAAHAAYVGAARCLHGEFARAG